MLDIRATESLLGAHLVLDASNQGIANIVRVRDILPALIHPEHLSQLNLKINNCLLTPNYYSLKCELFESLVFLLLFPQ